MTEGKLVKPVSKKVLGVTLASAVALGSFGFSQYSPKTEAKNEGKTVKQEEAKNVIMMVMDGTSSSATTLARWYKGEPLNMDKLVAGGVTTYSAESAITDSAPASTALATGNKSNSGYVGVLPSTVTTPGVEPVKEEDQFRPVANVLEGAQQTGRATGIISTSEIQHATPAGFSSHHHDRDNFEVIGEQQVYQNMDVILGGGKDSLAPGEGKKSRKDGENLVDVLDERGYDFVETRDDLLNSTSDKIWGSFSNTALAYDMDREQTRPEEPTLADMTGKAVDTLSKDKDGFFLFVEGSKPDWAAHSNDTIGMVSDVLAFDEALGEALEFAKKDGNTMVIAVSDHGNSGISIGNKNTTKGYDTTPVSNYIDPLKEAKMTVEGALSKLNDDLSNKEEVAALYGLKDLSEQEQAKLDAAKDEKAIGTALVEMLAERANIGFTTGGHTGEDMFLYSYGPNRPEGFLDNTDIAKHMAKALGVDLNKLTDELFGKASDVFKGAKTSIDKTDKANPVLVVEKGNKKAQLPVNKDIIIVNGKEYKLPGVVVQSQKGDFYVPKAANKLFNKAK
ncbi:alkaline phosphatase [Bacillus sp. CGMCC 1.16541]|uniref:alkaline phosphatase n=1 Tax=Bacillus sp. CGMCC 1.16541 TaxID=2185143 RepID=UPI000D7329D5|nr:alkaline phosphatase [Bacillus sp. CGMCC 1.16541]